MGGGRAGTGAAADDHRHHGADLRYGPAQAPRVAGPRDELRLLADTIDRLLERLEAAFDAQRRFVANASHELRTPLTTMRAVLDVAIAKPDAAPQLKSVDTHLRQALDQADRLLESFLALARAQHGQLDHAPVSLAQLAGDALARRGEAIAAKHIELRDEPRLGSRRPAAKRCWHGWSRT